MYIPFSVEQIFFIKLHITVIFCHRLAASPLECSSKLQPMRAHHACCCHRANTWGACGQKTQQPGRHKRWVKGDTYATMMPNTPRSTQNLGLRQYKGCPFRHEDFLYKDKTVVRLSYLYNGSPYTGKTASILRWPPSSNDLRSNIDEAYIYWTHLRQKGMPSKLILGQVSMSRAKCKTILSS